jgi:hypothetical protein
VIAPALDPAAGPGGYGFGAVSVDPVGNVSFSGVLGDGTKVTQKTFVSKTGQWPLYLSLYSGQGALFGWLSFTNAAAGDLNGLVNWSKPALAKAKICPEAFAMEGVQVAGSAYSYTAGTPVLNLANGGVVALQDGNLSQSLTNGFQLAASNKVSSTRLFGLGCWAEEFIRIGFWFGSWFW